MIRALIIEYLLNFVTIIGALNIVYESDLNFTINIWGLILFGTLGSHLIFYFIF